MLTSESPRWQMPALGETHRDVQGQRPGREGGGRAREREPAAGSQAGARPEGALGRKPSRCTAGLGGAGQGGGQEPLGPAGGRCIRGKGPAWPSLPRSAMGWEQPVRTWPLCECSNRVPSLAAVSRDSCTRCNRIRELRGQAPALRPPENSL